MDSHHLTNQFCRGWVKPNPQSMNNHALPLCLYVLIACFFFLNKCSYHLLFLRPGFFKSLTWYIVFLVPVRMEVIRRAPHEFKIACLEVTSGTQLCHCIAQKCSYKASSYQHSIFFFFLQDIKRLFPSDYNPFYAGFGNRDTDELSYRKIGIPKGKIFIINPKVCFLD